MDISADKATVPITLGTAHRPQGPVRNVAYIYMEGEKEKEIEILSIY